MVINLTVLISTSEIIFKDSYLFYSQNNEEECKESGKVMRKNQIQLAEYFGSMSRIVRKHQQTSIFFHNFIHLNYFY